MRKPSVREAMAHTTIAKMEQELKLLKPCTFNDDLCKLLKDRENYTIFAFTEAEFQEEAGEPSGRWRVAWWDAVFENFQDTATGDTILMQDYYKLLVIPTPLPKVIS